MSVKSNADWLIVKGESLTYKTKHGVVGGESLVKAGSGLKGEVLLSPFEHIPVGSKVEFQRNMGVQIRDDIFSIREQNIFLVGDLDELLKTKKEDGTK